MGRAGMGRKWSTRWAVEDVAAASVPSSFTSTTALWKVCSTASVRRAFSQGLPNPPPPQPTVPTTVGEDEPPHFMPDSPALVASSVKVLPIFETARTTASAI
ncbi:hypothetical protein ABZP36_009833 [Zizania latifolia]